MSERKWTGAKVCSVSPRSCRRKRPSPKYAAKWWRWTAAGRASAADCGVLGPHRGAVDNPGIDRYQAPMLRRLYDGCIAAAHKPYAAWIIGVVSFCESSFFPVPPDVMLIPMSLARPEKAYSYALLCTWTSVAGGVVGYLIGALLYDSVGHWVIQLYNYGDKVETF